MDLYSGVDANGNLMSDPNFRWHHSDQKNAVEVQNATNALNVALAYRQNDWNIEQWEREMQWNSPANQLRLLQEAGLNPLFYGQGLGANSKTQAPQSADLSVAGDFYQSQEQAKMANVASLLGSLGEQAGNIYSQFVQNKQLSLASQRLDIDKKEAMSRIIYNESKTEESKATARSLLKGLEVSDAEIEKLQQQVAESKVLIREIAERTRGTKLQNDFFEKTFNTRVARETLQNKLLSSEIFKNENQAYMFAQQFLHEIEKTKLTTSQQTYQDLTNIIQAFEANNIADLKLSDRERSRLMGTVYSFINEMLEGASDFNPGQDYLESLRHYNDRSSRNPSEHPGDRPAGAGWTPMDWLMPNE